MSLILKVIFPGSRKFFTNFWELGSSTTTQIIPIPDFIRNIPGRVSKAENDLLFTALDVPPLGWNGYLVTEKEPSHYSVKGALKVPKTTTKTEFKNLF